MTRMPQAAEVPFSDLINKPKETVAKVNRSRTRSLRLRRRDDEDLVLTTAAHAEQEREVVSATTRLFTALMSTDAGMRALVTEVVPEAFPWVRFLSAEGVRAFAVDLMQTLRAVSDLDNPVAVAQVITEWRHTAEAQSDPELMAILEHDHSDHGPAIAPDQTHEP